MQDANLNIKNISCKRQHHYLFQNLSFHLSAHDLCLVTGINGAGKSSLLRVLSGIATPAEGSIAWNHQCIYQHFSDYKKELHYIGHLSGLKLGLTVKENLWLIEHLTLQTPNTSIENILEALHLSAHLHQQAQFLSAGQKRKVALAKLFLFPKKIWILDEPFTALDHQTQQFFLESMEKHLKIGGMVIMSSHQSLSMTATKTIELGVC